jgi:type IV pilus assembly protein PilO
MATPKKAALGKLSTGGKIGVGLLMLSLPALGYFLVFHSEIQADIDSAKSKKQRLDQDLEIAQSNERNYQKDIEELRERERRRAELIKVLPITTEYPAFLASVQNVANLVGVELTAWTPEDEVAEEFYARVPMRIELTGRYHRLAKFFHNVGQVDRIINMENITIEDPTLVDGEVVLKVGVLATAFHAVDESLTGPQDEKSRRRDRQK